MRNTFDEFTESFQIDTSEFDAALAAFAAAMNRGRQGWRAAPPAAPRITAAEKDRRRAKNRAARKARRAHR